ncbi:hypothetical protein ACOMHN_024024 [Nucella lapillus]
MASGGSGENPEETALRREINKGVDGVAEPDEASGSEQFVQRFNIITGEAEWVWARADYDYQQEIARSSYADMLHDSERNEKYYAALSQAIKVLRGRGQQVKVLDIGTGTGLLSMMAASIGADSITACEAFEPMANCAEKVIEANGFSEQISLIHGRSTDVVIGKDMKQRANLLVTEVFDTELIGEGAIGTYTHAHDKLLAEDCLTVPRAANMYVQPVSSEHVRGWNTLRPVQVSPGGQHLRLPASCDRCGGAPSLHDLQLDQIPPSLFTALSPPVKVFRFDFSQKGALKKKDVGEGTVPAMADGQVDAIFVWWDLEMDPEGEIILSCAPHWAHPLRDKLPWRDHWMQAIFYPSQRLKVRQGEMFRILSHHDEYSLWFETATLEQQISVPDRPVCECGLHVAVSRSRLAMLGEEHRNSVLQEVLRECVKPDMVCVCISDFSFMPIMAANLGAKKVFVLDNNRIGTRLYRDIIRENQLEDKVVVIEKTAQEAVQEDFQGLQVDLVFGEPYFQKSSLPWDDLYYWYAVSNLRPLMSPGARVVPGTITIHAMALRLKDLWKIRAPVGLCQGFMLNIFDNLIKNASDMVDEHEESQPLWEYPGVCLSQPLPVLSIDMDHLHPAHLPNTTIQLNLTCEATDEVNGVALWCSYDFGSDRVLSTGPVQAPEVGQRVDWNPRHKQAVYLPHTPCAVCPGDTLDFVAHMDAQRGSLKFEWGF